MKSENIDTFKLINEGIEDWKDTEFIELTLTKGELKDIVLYVDWYDQDAMLAASDPREIACDVFNGLASEHPLSHSVNAVKFPQYYEDTIRPILQEIGKKYSPCRDVRGDAKCDIEYCARDEIRQLEYALRWVPTHSKILYSDIDEMFPDSFSELVDCLAPKIDFVEADLGDMEVVMEIRAEIERSCGGVILKSDDGVQFELEQIQDGMKLDIDVEAPRIL